MNTLDLINTGKQRHELFNGGPGSGPHKGGGKSESAQDAYARHTAAVKDHLTKIHTALENHIKEQAKNPDNAGHAFAMEHVASLLRSVHKGLNEGVPK